ADPFEQFCAQHITPATHSAFGRHAVERPQRVGEFTDRGQCFGVFEGRHHFPSSSKKGTASPESYFANGQCVGKRKESTGEICVQACGSGGFWGTRASVNAGSPIFNASNTRRGHQIIQ